MFTTIERFPDYEIDITGQVRTKKTKYLKSCKLDRGGYYIYQLQLDKKEHNINRHRLIAETFIPNPNNKWCVDHINGIRTDDRLENLRWATASENLQNKTKQCNGHYSIYKGVSFDKNRNKWKVRINKNGKPVFQARFDTEREAVEAYNKNATIHFGEFARLNVFQN